MEIMKMFQKPFGHFYQESRVCDFAFAVVCNVLVADENKSVNQQPMN
jgi:hypothetical protein